MKKMKVIGVEAPLLKLDKALSYLKKALSGLRNKNPKIILFPEKWITDILVEGSERFRYAVRTLENMSSDHSLTFIPGSLSIQRSHGLFNTSPIVSDGEIIGWQDKIMPFQQEKKYYSPGSSIRTFDLGGIRIGIQICYDIDFPFVSKIQASQGVDVILNPSMITKNFHSMWYIYIKSRSLENRIPVLSVNTSSDPYLGGSAVTSLRYMDGGIIIRLSKAKENIIESDIDVDFVRKHSRERIKEDKGAYSLKAAEKNYYNLQGDV